MKREHMFHEKEMKISRENLQNQNILKTEKQTTGK